MQHQGRGTSSFAASAQLLGQFALWGGLALLSTGCGGEAGVSISAQAVQSMAEQIREVRELGVQVVIVIGGGNIFRGLPGSERGHVDIVGRYQFWRGELAWNKSDFYDLFGPTKRSRKGYAAKVGYDELLIWDEPRKLLLAYDLEYYDKIDTLPNAQNVGTPFTRLFTAQVGLHYSDVRQSLGAVDDENGIAWNVVLKGNQVKGDTPVQLGGNVDYGIALPLAHSSLWLRSSAGWANGDASDPYANFYFGAFGNNWVDDG